MQPSKPGIVTDNLLQHTSVAKVLAGNVSFGSGKTYDANSVPLTFYQDNGEGVLIRHVFTTTASDEVIVHNLGRVPIGYILTRTNSPANLSDAMNNTGWTKSQILLRSTAAADTTIYIF